ncbi:MAG: site-specific DNA-methyltransferase, partial [Selenomonadaceae bacterium]|nr:site-specific DNA-methyltransferase [Selenomonadaceae bacterium]
EETARQLEATGRVEIMNGIVKKAVYPQDEADSVTFKPFWSHLRADEVGTAQSGKELLNSIMGAQIGFDTVKPPALIEELIRHFDKNSLVLDAFAGSGTTAHAVINLNAADGGKRKFILIEQQDYCQTIVAERVKRVGGGFKFCRLGEEIFDAAGNFNHALTFEQLAKFIWFNLTGKPLSDKKISPLIGVHDNTAVYLLHGANDILTRETLATLPAYNGQKLIFASACRLSERFLRNNEIEFHPVPNDLRT